MKSLTLRAKRTPRVQLRGDRLFWEPSKTLRLAGYKSQPLGPLTTAALAAADQLNETADALLARGADDRPAARSLADVLARYRKSRAFAKLTPRGQADYARHLNRAAAALGKIPADQLTAAAVQKWHDKLAAASGADARNSLSALRAALTWAKLGGNPAAGVTDLAPRIRRQRIATRGEVWAMIRTADMMGLPSVATAILTSVATMQRVSDTLSLTRAHIDSGVLYLTQSKTGADLSFRLHPLVIDGLGTLPEDPAAPIFINPETDRAYTLRAFERAWCKVRSKAAASMPSLTGADPAVRLPTLKGALTVRDLRRSGMVWAAESGATLPQIRSVSGHSLQGGLTILETYLPHQRSLADQAVARLDLLNPPALDDLMVPAVEAGRALEIAS